MIMLMAYEGTIIIHNRYGSTDLTNSLGRFV